MADSSNRRSWIVLFIVFGFLAAAAAAISLAYNLRQQLKPEGLQAAREKWLKNAPESYDLEYVQRGSIPGYFIVKVRKGKIVSIHQKSSKEDPGEGVKMEERFYGERCGLGEYYSMLGLFDNIKRFLDVDAEPGQPRAFNKAIFDDKDGRLTYYIRSVSKNDFRLEIEITRYEPVAADGGDGKK